MVSSRPEGGGGWPTPATDCLCRVRSTSGPGSLALEDEIPPTYWGACLYLFTLDRYIEPSRKSVTDDHEGERGRRVSESPAARTDHLQLPTLSEPVMISEHPDRLNRCFIPRLTNFFDYRACAASEWLRR